MVVQKVLRHRDPKLTEATYGHLATDFLRAEVNRLKLEGMPRPEEGRARAASVGHVTPVLPTSSETPKGPRRHGENPSNLDPFSVRAIQDSNLWPLAPEKTLLHFRRAPMHVGTCRNQPNPAGCDERGGGKRP
jgi:hypothetical protein